jgi:hypothetical protein
MLNKFEFGIRIGSLRVVRPATYEGPYWLFAGQGRRLGN